MYFHLGLEYNIQVILLPEEEQFFPHFPVLWFASPAAFRVRLKVNLVWGFSLEQSKATSG